MSNWKKWTVSLTLALFTLVSLHVAPRAAAEPTTPVLPMNLAEVMDGEVLFEPLKDFVANELSLSDDDASVVGIESFHEVDLGNYPKGYTRQFLAFVYNY